MYHPRNQLLSAGVCAWLAVSPLLVHGQPNDQRASRSDSTIVFAGGRLVYEPNDQGDRIPDYSYCGFAGADDAVPNVPVRVRVSPMEGDATRRIQAAIDYVASLPLDEAGFRGAVFLSAGIFPVEGSLHIRDSGVVLRGAGAGPGGTVLRAAGLDRRTLIRIHGTGTPAPEDSHWRISDDYVPVGATTFHLTTTTGLTAGDAVIVSRPSTQEWIAAIQCDVESLGWRPGSRDVQWRRVIVRIDENAVEVNAPITTSIDQRFGGGILQRYAWPGLIQHVGVEDLQLVSDYRSESPRDEEHAWHGVTMNCVRNGWVRRVGFRHFAGGAVLLGATTQHITVEDCVSEEPISEIGGYRRHTFFTQGQQCLFLRCWSDQGHHDFSVGHCAAGPNAFVQCYAARATGDSGPHESWASGVLYDNVRIDGSNLHLGNRWSNPPKAGWSAANCMLWQCQAANVVCETPPTAQNWAIGIWATPSGNGTIQGVSDFVSPISLYQQQVQERLGQRQADSIGPFLLNPVGATNPSVEQAQQFVAASNAPGRQLKDLIHERWASVSAPDFTHATDAFSLSAPAKQPNPPARLALRNGWLVVDGSLVVGGHLTPTWWRGTLIPEAAPEMGHAITRFAPGRTGAGLTDDLREVLTHMRANHLASYDHHYGLWYDRRRDDHLMVRRADGEVAPPFYEQPFARSGQGTAWDGLSKYDLTSFNAWYWQRLADFAQLCEEQGRILFHHGYFQHNIIEAGAHWADTPWRPANNINQVALPEPPPYVGDKRIFLAHKFYDLSDPNWRRIHESYIAKCLDNFAGNSNVIQLTSAEYTGPLSFTQFWLDTIGEWEKENGKQVLTGLSCTKDGPGRDSRRPNA